jgi:hypothetical protein
MRLLLGCILATGLVFATCPPPAPSPIEVVTGRAVDFAVESVPALSAQPSEIRIAGAQLAQAEILKSAAAAFAAGKLTDGEVGKLRAAARRQGLDISIAESLSALVGAGLADRGRLERALTDLDVSTQALVALWSKYTARKPKR